MIVHSLCDPEEPIPTMSEGFDTFEVRLGLMSRYSWVNYLRMSWDTMSKDVEQRHDAKVPTIH